MDNLPNFHLGNLILFLSVVAWAVAQILKVVVVLVQKHRLDFRNILSSGGMPSSHSAFVCACAAATGNLYGWSSALFAIAAVLAIVVMYDAMGVRRETGKQAKLLNMIMEQDFFKFDNELFQKRLKEFVGHTPLQVAAGAVLGIVLAIGMEYLYV